MKNKYIWILSFLSIIAFSFLMMFCNPTVLNLHSEYPAKVSPEEETELRERIFNLKNNVNEELLKKCHISVDSRLQPAADFQFNELSKAINACHTGGVSHPENFGYIILEGIYENMAFNIEIKFAKVSGTKTAYLTINALDENGDEIYGIPFISDELTDWAWKVISCCLFTVDGYIAPHSFVEIFYALHERENFPVEKCREAILKLCAVFSVVAENKNSQLKDLRKSAKISAGACKNYSDFTEITSLTVSSVVLRLVPFPR